MKKALLGFVLMGLAPAAVASAGDRSDRYEGRSDRYEGRSDRYEGRSHGGARVGISVNLRSGHRNRHHDRAPVIRHRGVVVDSHNEVLVHDEYGDHAVIIEHRPRVYDHHEVYDGGHRDYRRQDHH